MRKEIWRETPGSVKLLLLMSFIMNIGFYALIPYLTLYMTGSIGWTLAMAGLVLSVRQFSQQGFSFLGGLVSDKFGYKGTMVLGLLIRATGFCAFAFCTETWHFFLAAVLSGLGGSLFEPAGSAAYAILTPEPIRKDVFAFRNVLGNVGVVGSQIVGTALSSFDFFWLSIFAGALYYLLSIVGFLCLPAATMRNTRQSLMQSIIHVIKDKPFMLYTLILIGYYYLYMQIFLTIPQFVEDTLGSKTFVGIVLSTVSVATILFQMKIIQWLAHFQQRFTLIGLGALLMGIGMFFFTFADSLWAIMLDSVIFALGTMISMPYLIEMVPLFAPKEQIGAYYGFNGYSLAFGGSLGTFIGGWVYDLGVHQQLPWLAWSICLLVGIVVAWLLYQLEQKVGVGLQAEF
ncbi:MDR family MFS transporter [Brevibacillus fluminis]|uniref:MDR family MFS transporter n=1 Tax=Brevibacillus fluminis TaxID=511487 RepID=UPI003F895D65